ncbi:uncharacterized protein FIBRA_03503 [Fibroporia radiculosa]|uniref:Small nuclear ribonucleoprotein Prp3 C-terminal domain-containing protein n=1 Tax=Fibroporia radiculosa TaxID=599839 RepID=J4GNI5_9APHY|nr:uncharacterized protein FIBRA_03503 [Fibroporia radiculosa]CCM01450.1 predicted protein [Fibroporia radiculosa]
MALTTTTLAHQLEELSLLKCSILPGEEILFIPSSDGIDHWGRLLDTFIDNSMDSTSLSDRVPGGLKPARFQVKIDVFNIWFEVAFHEEYHGDDLCSGRVLILVKGDNLGRIEQEHWQTIVREKMNEVKDSEYPVFELISTHLLPELHATFDARAGLHTASSTADPGLLHPANAQAPRFHALLTSHHLISPNKRRSLQQWSGELSVTGFAKVGYPGVIYCEGERVQLQKFVANVKAMQWLALRIRFVEPLPQAVGQEYETRRRWVEFEKVGKVVEEMKRLKRENYVVEMGIGSTSMGSSNAMK